MYRTVDAKFWTDPKVAKLSPEARFLFLYLITNAHTHVSGIYYLPLAYIAAETGLPSEGIDTLCHTLSIPSLVKFDKENHLIWVVNMMSYQGVGQKCAKSAAKHLEKDLHNSFLIHEFLEKYPHVKKFMKRIPHRYPIDTLTRVATPEQEQDISNKVKGLNLYSCPEPEKTPDHEPPQKPILIFPTHGKTKTWELTQGVVDYLQAGFPGVEILPQCRKALAWCHANPTKQKTAGGMPKFLFGWIERNQNGGKYGSATQGNQQHNRSGVRPLGRVESPVSSLDAIARKTIHSTPPEPEPRPPETPTGPYPASDRLDFG